MATKEIITEIFVFGDWFEIRRGTFRLAEGGPRVFGQDEIYTWLGMDGARYYARRESVKGVEMICVDSTTPDEPEYT